MPPENSESGSKSKSAGGDITSNATTPQHVENSDLDSSFPFLAISSANQPDSHAETTIEAQQDEGDAQEVFQASLDFQNKQAPDPQVLDRRSSSSSLYPSLESVSQVGGENIEVELSWEAATISQKKKAGEKHKSQAAAANNSNLQLTELTQSTRDEEGIGVFEDGSRIGSIGNRINAHLRHLSVASSMGSQQDEYWMDETSSNALGAAARIPTCTAATEDDDMIAMKRAAYHGHDTDSTTHSLVARMPQHHQAEAIVVEDLHPSDIIGYAVQAEFVGQDYGAAMNHRTHQIENRPPATEASHVTSSEDSEVEVLATATADTTEVTEATVIESGPIEKATAEAWSVAPAAEAMVLQDGGSEDRVVDTDSKPPAIDHSQRRRDNDDGTRGNFSTAINGVQADQEAEATVVDYDIHPSAMTSDAVHAEFVGQDYNSTAGFSNSVEERFSATEASRVAATAHDVVNVEESGVEEATEATVIESGPIEKATAQAWSAAPAEEAQVLEENVATTIAEVDSKPHDTGDPEAWVTNDSNDDRFAMANGEAEVVGITEEPHPSEFTEEAAQAELIGADFNTAIAVPSMNHQEHSAGNTNEGLVEEATIVIHGESHAFVDVPSVPQIPPAEPQEAQATLINDEELTHLDQQGGSSVAQEAPSATAILEENYSNRNISSLTQLDATPVTVLEERNVEHSSASCFYDPVKPFAGQTTSYEATQVPTSPLENDPDGPAMSRDELAAMDVLNEPSWMNAPSLGGDNTDLPPPVVIPTPASPYATVNAEDQHVVVPPIPSPTEFAKTSPNTSRTEGRSDLSNSQSCGFQVLSSNIARGTSGVMEILFGNGKPFGNRSTDINLESLARSVLPRTLLPSSVIYSEATSSWVATVNTNQKALETNNVEESSKALRAFAVPTKKQAMALARAWAPPKMHPFASNPVCFVCETHFAVFRRACHCRNCGVCVCNSCSVQWPSKMLPATYNIKRVSVVNICKACDWLCSVFRLALLQGDHDKAVALYSTGNINLTTPFANVKGELFYPVHCAVLGGNLKLLTWLVDEHCCPLRSIRISDGKQRDNSGSYTPILTSKGRSLLSIALSNKNIGIVRYLVVEKRMLLSAEKGLSVETLVENLDLVLRVLPEEIMGEQSLDQSETRNMSYTSATQNIDNTGPVEQDSMITATCVDGETEDEASGEECIICCSNDINCVITPCGHQICCLECSRNISRCPVCSAECEFMRVFKP